MPILNQIFIHLYEYLLSSIYNQQLQMENYQNNHIDLSIIQMMKSVRTKIMAKDINQSLECLLLQEKIIYASLIYNENSPNNQEIEAKEKDQLGELIVSFAQKVNKLTMENYEKQQNQASKDHERLINKCTALLMIPSVEAYVKEGAQLCKLKILSFNNLSCLYKKKKKYGIALRAINHALSLEEQLLGDNINEQKYDIVPTYLNKAAVCSEMGKHAQAIQIVLKAKTHIQTIECELIKQIQGTVQQSQKQRLIEKRYYGLYMKMLILYNMGAQKQHLRLRGQALECYKQSKQTAVIINNQLMIDKLESVIDSLLESEEQRR